MVRKVELYCIWQKSPNFTFNTLLVGPLFYWSSPKLLFGTTDGMIRIFSNQEEEMILETKGGSIQILQLQNTTNFGSVDLISGDIDGTVTLFSRSQILSRNSFFRCPISSLVFDDSSSSIVVSGRDGTLASFRAPNEYNWKIQTEDEASPVCCLFSAIIPDKYGVMFPVLMVCTENNYVYYYNQGCRIFSLAMPSKVNTLCQGFFEILPGKIPQIVAGCQDGFIYLLQDYQYTRYISVGHPINHILSYNIVQEDVSLLFCAGHFNALHIYHCGHILLEHKTSEWVQTLSIGDVDNDGEDEIVVGLLNNFVQVFKLIEKTEEPKL